MQHDEYKELLSGFLDRELSPEKAAEVNNHLIRCESCRMEYEELRETMHKLDKLSFEEPEDRVLKNLWKQPYHRFQKKAGLFLVLVGYLILMLFAIYQLAIDKSMEAIPKIAIIAIILGFVLLIAMVLRERLATYKIDRYKEIEK